MCVATLLVMAGCSSSEPKGPEKPDTPDTSDKPSVTPGGDDEAVTVNPSALYNGIELPAQWPPQRNAKTDIRKGMSPFYLADKPEVIYATAGRQLFVDDFLIARTSLRRVFHYPEIAETPVMVPDQWWETSPNGKQRFAAPFSDGVWYDEAARKFKMWYMAGQDATCYAESADGLIWVKPACSSVEPGTNILRRGTVRDGVSVWLDKREEAEARFRMFEVSGGAGAWTYKYLTSSDGILWRDQQAESQRVADRSTAFYSPFRDVWVWSMRHNVRLNASDPYTVRARDYMEHHDPAQGNRLAVADLSRFWFGTWPQERRWEGNTANDGAPGIYNFDAMPYESLMVGFFSVWQGPENDECNRLGIVKRNQICVGYSRDGGYSWQRDDMAPFIPVGDGASWRAGNIQSALGSPLIVADKLYFYFSGRSIDSGVETTSTGVATLRRDGFASMSGSGELLTEPLLLDGATLWVNARVGGSFKVEVLHKDGTTPYPALCKELSAPADGCALRLIDGMEAVKGKAVRLRFTLSDSDLYSFWAGDTQGHSLGYTAGGGPGLNAGGIDK